FLHVREPAPVRAPSAHASIRQGLDELARTLRRIRGQTAIITFLIAYWLYIDGVYTIIRMAVDFGLNLGFSSTSLILALLLVQFIGFPAAVAFGHLGERWGTKKALYLGLRSEEHTSELQSRFDLVCRLLLEKKNNLPH